VNDVSVKSRTNFQEMAIARGETSLGGARSKKNV